MLYSLSLPDGFVSFLQYSLAYACLKLVNYSFFFWLPFYLSNNFGWKEAEADKLSIWYDVGGIIGTPGASSSERKFFTSTPEVSGWAGISPPDHTSVSPERKMALVPEF